MKIVKAKLISRKNGSDVIFLETDLKDACYPYDAPMNLKFEAAKGSGHLYLKIHFNAVPIEHFDEDGNVVTIPHPDWKSKELI